MQPWQAYHALTYESKWKAVIDQKWEEYNIEWAKEQPEQPLVKTQFEFMNAFIKEKYEAESDDTKERVEQHRQDVATKPLDNTNKAFQE